MPADTGADGQQITPPEEWGRLERVRVDLSSAQESCNFLGILTHFWPKRLQLILKCLGFLTILSKREVPWLESSWGRQ